MANVELNVPARPETVYKIGSVSKQLIATGIMLLIQEGKMNLDDKISKFLRLLYIGRQTSITTHAR